MRTEIITSAQNPKIKNLLLLQEKSKARREQGLFVVEGRRELEHCLRAGFRLRTLFICPEILAPETYKSPSSNKKADSSGDSHVSGAAALPFLEASAIILAHRNLSMLPEYQVFCPVTTLYTMNSLNQMRQIATFDFYK